MSSGPEPRLPAEFEQHNDDPAHYRCWAHGPYGRCEKNGGHGGDHQIVQTWTDEECLDPAVYVPKVSLSVASLGALSADTMPEVSTPPTNSDRCFSCGCSEAAHLEVGDDGEAMCPKHQCRTFVA